MTGVQVFAIVLVLLLNLLPNGSSIILVPPAGQDVYCVGVAKSSTLACLGAGGNVQSDQTAEAVAAALGL